MIRNCSVLYCMLTEEDVFTAPNTRDKIKLSALQFRMAQLQEAHNKAIDSVDTRLKEVLANISDDVKSEKVRNLM
jgi:hypothetical protein